MPTSHRRPGPGVGLVRVLHPAQGWAAPVGVGRGRRRLRRVGRVDQAAHQRPAPPGRRPDRARRPPGTGTRSPPPSSRWTADELETAVVVAGGAAAALRSVADWDRHPQGRAVAAEPLVHRHESTARRRPGHRRHVRRPPLAGVRVLDLTRVLAGPVATRLLAGWGADVLRIDPPWWDEPAVVPEVTLGKRCARLDLHVTPGPRPRSSSSCCRSRRPRPRVPVRCAGGPGPRGGRCAADVRPGLVDVSLDAYGWTGPWAARRGFDSLVQMSSGIAEAGHGRGRAPATRCRCPVQALDHATGYLLAAAALTGAGAPPGRRTRAAAGARRWPGWPAC